MKKINVELTSEQLSTLVVYILMTTNHRKGEREAWHKLADEICEDGAPRFPNAARNAEYYDQLEIDLEEITNILYKAF